MAQQWKDGKPIINLARFKGINLQTQGLSMTSIPPAPHDNDTAYVLENSKWTPLSTSNSTISSSPSRTSSPAYSLSSQYPPLSSPEAGFFCHYHTISLISSSEESSAALSYRMVQTDTEWTSGVQAYWTNSPQQQLPLPIIRAATPPPQLPQHPPQPLVPLRNIIPQPTPIPLFAVHIPNNVIHHYNTCTMITHANCTF